MTKKSAIHWYVASIFLFLFSCATPNKPFPVETIEVIKHSVIPIVCIADNTIMKIMGSAFLINQEGYFITDAHVLEKWDDIIKQNRNCFPAIYVPTKEWDKCSVTDFMWLQFGSCQKDMEKDIAVCKTDQNPFILETVKLNIVPAILRAYKGLSDGTPVAFTGFPLEFVRPITSIGHLATSGNSAIVIDKGNWPGASGSAIYIEDGTIIGILTKRGINEGVGLTYGNDSEVIINFLRKHKVNFRQKESK